MAAVSVEVKVASVIRSWVYAGRHPAHHQHKKEQLRREWPQLANALDNLAKEILGDKA